MGMGGKLAHSGDGVRPNWYMQLAHMAHGLALLLLGGDQGFSKMKDLLCSNNSLFARHRGSH